MEVINACTVCHNRFYVHSSRIAILKLLGFNQPVKAGREEDSGMVGLQALAPVLVSDQGSLQFEGRSKVHS